MQHAQDGEHVHSHYCDSYKYFSFLASQPSRVVQASSLLSVGGGGGSVILSYRRWGPIYIYSLLYNLQWAPGYVLFIKLSSC